MTEEQIIPKTPKVKAQSKLLWIALPIGTVLTLAVLLTAGGTDQVGGLRDIMAYVFELAPKTLYAIAIGGSSAMAMHLTGMDLGNRYRAQLVNKAADGDPSAMIVLGGETFAWLAWTVLWAFVYLH